MGSTEFSGGTDLGNLFVEGERLEEIEDQIKQWNLVVDYDPEPDEETLRLQGFLGERMKAWKEEVGWINKDNYDPVKLENWRRKFLQAEEYASIT